MGRLLWGSDEFIARTEVINDQYVRPVDDKSFMEKLEDCDMHFIRPLLDLGLFVYATDDEVRQWKVGRLKDE